MLLVAGTARAQDDLARLIDRPITAVRFEIEGRPITSLALDRLVAIHAGEPFRLDAERDSISHLYNAAGYDDVQVFYTEEPSGLVILFRLTPRHPVDRLAFTGDTGLGQAELDRLVRERYGGLPTREQPDAVARAVVDLLREEGFLAARVTPRIDQTHNPDRATLVLDIAAGRRAVIAYTKVTGTSLLSHETIIARTGTASGQLFRDRAVDAALAAIGDELRRQGYYSAVAIMPNEPVDTGQGLLVSLRVDAGPRVFVRWDGPKPPGADEDYVPMRRQRSVDEDLLEDSDRRVESYWRSQGFSDAKVTHTREEQTKALVIVMHTTLSLRHRIQQLNITGNVHLSEATILKTLAVVPGDPYDHARLATGIGRVTSTYRQLGYYLAVVKELDPEDVPGSRTPGEVRHVVRIDVSEGPEAHVGTLTFTGNRAEPESVLLAQMQSRRGGLYVLDNLRRDQANLVAYYRNRGFEDVDVVIKQQPSADQQTIDVSVAIAEGPQVTVGDIRIVGYRRESDQSIRAAMTLREGQPYGDAARLESYSRLRSMAVFRRISIDAEPRRSGETVVHVIVTVEELPANSFSYGGGLEGARRALRTADGGLVDRMVLAPRASFEIGRRNFWGKNRSVDFFSRLAPGLPNSDAQGFSFTEYRVSGTYREPHAFNSDADALFVIASEQASRTDFNFARRSLTAELVRRVSPRVSVSGRYTLDSTRLFDVRLSPDDRLTIDKVFPQVRLSALSSGAVWDRRNDPVDPARGTLTTANVEVAARGLGSEVGYAKTFLQAAGFHALSSTRRMVLAGRAEVGFARGFERGVPVLDDNGHQVIGPDGKPVTEVVADLPASQRFFAGGSTTVRGFQLDRLGVPEILTSDGLSKGGNGVVVLNAELRVTIGKLFGREFGVVGFTDAGNVFAKAGDIDFSKLRGAYGFGARYNSWLGPVRLDFGFKTDPQVIGGMRERRWEYHLNIGEAF